MDDCAPWADTSSRAREHLAAATVFLKDELALDLWSKVIKDGNTGAVHYFEHASGQVAGVKFFPKQAAP
jgi:hypothetical protein